MTTPNAPPRCPAHAAAALPPEPQPVVNPLCIPAYFVVLNIAPGAEAEDAVRAFFGNAAALVRSVGRRLPAEALTMVVGIGSKAWDRLFDGPRPAQLHDFKALQGDKHQAPTTPGDLLLHIRAGTVDLCFELATQCLRELGQAVQPVDEVHGFRYFDARAMIGFVDGVENPEGRAAFDATLIGDEDPGFAGGSYVIVQKYLHDMAAWNALSTEEQERVIGRTKADNIELAEDVKPINSHSALTTVEDANGVEMDILRGNLPFANVSRGEFGTYFIGYARDPAVTELMLTNMFIGRPPGNYDRLLDFSTAVTGTLFFVPPLAMLEALADGNPLAQADTGTDTPASAPNKADDGSMRIGSLKGEPQLRAMGGGAKRGHTPTN